MRTASCLIVKKFKQNLKVPKNGLDLSIKKRKGKKGKIKNNIPRPTEEYSFGFWNHCHTAPRKKNFCECSALNVSFDHAAWDC